VFPACEGVAELLASDCKYELHRLVKVVWSGLREGARTAFEVSAARVERPCMRSLSEWA
jgi:hypothetical protein